MLYIGVLTKLIFRVRIVTQVFSKWAPPARNNIITNVNYFLQPLLCLIIPTSGVFSVLPMGLCRLRIHWHPAQKQPRYSETSPISAKYPSTFTLGTPDKWNTWISGRNNIVPRPTNVHQPLKCFNKLAIQHSVKHSRVNTYSVWFRKHCPELVIANGRYRDGLPKRVHFYQFQK